MGTEKLYKYFEASAQEANIQIDELFRRATEGNMVHHYPREYDTVPIVVAFSPRLGQIMEFTSMYETYPLHKIQRVVGLRPCVAFREIIYPDTLVEPRFLKWDTYGSGADPDSFRGFNIEPESKDEAFARISEMLGAEDLQVVPYDIVLREDQSEE